MKRFLVTGALAFLAVALVATPAAARKKYSKVKGHVIKVEQQVKTANGGETDRLTIRTRQGEEMQLHLGQGGACEGCYQEGDRIRAKVRAGDGSGAGREIQSMKLRRGSEQFGYVNANGKMVRDRSGKGMGAGGVRGRGQRTGSGDCAGCAAGQRSGVGAARGGSRGGGRGGGRG